jgi:hypothetical protein
VKSIGFATLGCFMAAAGWGQAPAPPAAPASTQVNPQINLVLLAKALQSASTFHDLVKNLNVEKALNPGPTAAPLDRTVTIMGAGAGAGAAIGELSHSQKGMLIGIAAGAAGGFVVDQILRQREAKASTSSAVPAP